MNDSLNIGTDRWWMVRAEGGTLQQYFRANSIVAAGSATPKADLSGVGDLDALRARMTQAPGGAEFVLSRRFEEVVDFVLRIQPGDVVVTPSKGTTNVLVRTIVGPYEYHPTDPHGLHLHRRVGAGVVRDVHDDLRRELSSRQTTVFAIHGHVVHELRTLVAADRVHRL